MAVTRKGKKADSGFRQMSCNCRWKDRSPQRLNELAGKLGCRSVLKTPRLQGVRESSSFAPLGLASFYFFTHALRRGLHSFAASRL
jgi:hypothetical protein